jgi:hypothetical protein
MPNDNLAKSLSSGPHAMLNRLAGEWAGTCRTWFEPGVLADETSVSGSIRPVLEGRFALHEYAGTLDGQAYQGLALYGYELPAGRYVAAWVDSFHNGTAIMFSQTRAADGGSFSVMGSYGDPGGGPDWGWRTTIELSQPDRLVITHYNITPQGEEAKAVEMDYQRA